MPTTYPGGLSELDFVEAYCASALRKPSVVADSVLRALVLAGQNERAALSGLIAEQLAEACRRLAAVSGALSNRTHSVARTLMQPLPGAGQWMAFAQDAGTLTPEQMLRHLSLGDAALDAATKLRSLDNLGALQPYVAAVEVGALMFLLPPSRGSRAPTFGWLAGADASGEPVAIEVLLDEQEAAALADLTADLSGIARAFLGAYLDARRGAGRRE
ncbi:MAG: hypothetical protein WD557_06535 [Dehalococcoidia bacterium]